MYRLNIEGQSALEYSAKHRNLELRDLITPVGNFTDLQYFWESASLVSKYLPGAVKYYIASIPEMLEAAFKAAQLDLSNMVEFAHLVRLSPTRKKPVLAA